MLSTWGRAALALLLCLPLACGDDDGTSTMDAGLDAADVGADVPLPPGPRGDVLRIPESRRTELPVEGEVYVLRTEANVPHVYASNEHDLRVVQGFLMARDRYFQIEAGRRLGQGRLTELIGDAALGGDVDARTRGMARIAQRLADNLTPDQREVVQAFTDGINAYVRAVKARSAAAPSELQIAYTVFGARSPGELMEELTVEDVIAFAAVPVYQLGWEAKDLRYAAAEAELADAFADDPLRRAGATTDIFGNVTPIHEVSSSAGFGVERASLLPGRATPHRRLRAPARLSVPPAVLRRALDGSERFERRLRGDVRGDFGSNAWAVMGEHTEDGATLLAGDGHLPLSIAPLFYQLGLDTSVFGEGEDADVTLMGLFFAGIPHMAVGTNGRIAWSQTYLRGDVTDWYAEELVLDAEGRPTATRFDGAERPLQAIDEDYVIRDVPALGSAGRTETLVRFETFDGRPLTAIEGREVTADYEPGPGETLLNVSGAWIVPGDQDGDDVVSAISFDFAGFDVSNILRALRGFNEADTVGDFRAATRELVTYAQNLIAADVQGDVYYGSYNAIPTREYLERDGEGVWTAGSDPRGLLDGTRYRGFEIVLDADGLPDESLCADPYRCLVPFERWPAALSPDRGWVMTANNDIANITTDGDFYDDEFYLGGPWNNGFRGTTIAGELNAAVADGSASLAGMRAIQDDHRSVLGALMGPLLLASIDEGQRLASEGARGEDDERLLAIYESDAAAFDEVATRLRAWIARGADAASGVETFYAPAPSDDERDDSVATMIFNAWWKAAVQRVFADEAMDFAFAADFSTSVTRAMHDVYRGRGEGDPIGLASWDAATGESAFFDDVRTPDVTERSFEVTLSALADALEGLRAAPDPELPGIGGFGTPDMDEWRWGLRHLVKFESIVASFVGSDPAFAILADGFSITPERLPLLPGLGDEDPRATLPWFPRPGDLFNVDAAHYAITGRDYFYANGPVMRMVIRLEADDITGVNILPGGQSGLTNSDHFDDQAALWLANDTVPLRFEVADVVAGATSRETYVPLAAD